MLRIALLTLLFSLQVTSQDYRWPIRASQSLSATFCEYRDGHLHAGIDIKTWGEMEVPCLAIADGYIEGIVVGYHGYGRGLFLRLKDGKRAIYGHLERFTDDLEDLVQVEQRSNEKYYTRLRFSPEEYPVKAGEVIGFSGTSGTEHPHLHFEIRDTSDIAYNPQGFYSGIRDSRKPVMDEIMLISADTTTRINNSRFPVRIDAGDDETPILTTGPFYTLVNTHDRANGTYNKYNIYRADVFLNDSLSFSYRFDQLPLTHYDSVDVVYPGMRGKRKWRFMSMFKSGNSQGYPFIGNDLTGLLDPDRVSTLRFRISDIKRNVLTKEFILKPALQDSWSIKEEESHYLITRSYPDKGYERFEFYTGDNEFIPVAQTFYRLNSTSWMIIKTADDSGIRALGVRGVGLRWVVPPQRPEPPEMEYTWARVQWGYVLRLVSDSTYAFPLSFRIKSEKETYTGELVQTSESSAETDIIPLSGRASGEVLYLTVDERPIHQIELDPLHQVQAGDSLLLTLSDPDVALQAINTGASSIYIKLDTTRAKLGDDELIGATIHNIAERGDRLEGELIFKHPDQPGKWSIYTPSRRQQWKRLNSIDSLGASIISLNGNGRYFLVNDVEAPQFNPVKTYHRVRHGDRMVFEINENTRRFKYRESLKTARLDGMPLYPDYNPLRHELSFHVPNDLESGAHMLRITLMDHADNSFDYSFQFHVAP